MKKERTVPFYKIERADIKLREITHDYALHWHDYFEIEFVVSGKGKQILNGKEYMLEPGSLSILTTNDFHAVYPDSELTLFNLSFQISELSSEFIMQLINGGGTCITCYGSEFERFKAIFKLLCDAQQNVKNDEYLKTMLRGLLLLIVNKIPIHEPLQNNYVQNVKLYIHTHFRHNPTLSEIAKAACISPNYLCEKFRKETGKTVLEFLTEQKINYAETLLKSTNLSITDICFSSGFSSVSNFLRAFKILKNTSPSAYRKMK